MSGKGSTPDYTGAAMQQALASKEATNIQTWANRPQINTPWGQQTWQSQATVDPATGQPVTSWQTDINLTPEQQSALDAQMRIGAGKSAGAETLVGQAVQNFQTPMNWNAIPGRAAALRPQDYASEQQRAYGIMSQMLQPGRQQEQAALETKLANMGLPRGSQAWEREMASMRDRFSQQDKSMMAQALAEGRLNVGGQFGMQQQAAEFAEKQRQAAIGEEAQRRGMTLNELNALLTGSQVSMPQMPSFSQATKSETPQLLQAAQMQGQANESGGMDWGSLIGTAAKVGGMAMMSDLRLKSNLEAIGAYRGLTVYAFDLGGRRRVGVLAQDVAVLYPHAVIVGPAGYLMVDYAAL